MFPTIFPIVENPFDKTNPDLGVWGLLGEKGLLILGGIWGAGLLACAVWLVIGIVKFGRAKHVSRNPDALNDASKSVLFPVIAIACLAGVGTIFGAAAGLFA